eukprot:g6623.t1
MMGAETQPAPWPLIGQTVQCDSAKTGGKNGECYSTSCPQVCTCTLTVWNCDDTGITEVPKGYPPTVLNIFLRGNKIAHVPKHAFRDLPNVEVIELSANIIKSIDYQAFQNLPRLQRILLNDNPLLTHLMPSTFYKMDRITDVRLDNCNITAIHKGVFLELPFLETLNLAGNRHLNHIELNSIRDLPNLKMLNLLHTGMETLHWLGGMQFVTQGLPSLKMLRMKHTQFTSMDPDTLLSLAPAGGAVQTLETPDLRTNFNDMTALTHLDLTMKECELMEHFGVVHGKTADDYITDR